MMHIMKHKKRHVNVGEGKTPLKFLSFVIIVGLLTPILVTITTGLVLDPNEFLDGLKYNFSLGRLKGWILTIFCNVIPYSLLAILGMIFLSRKNNRKKRSIKYGMISSFLLIFLTNIFLYTTAEINIYSGDLSSTAGLVEIFFPLYATFSGAIGYGIGWSVGRYVEKKEKRGK